MFLSLSLSLNELSSYSIAYSAAEIKGRNISLYRAAKMWTYARSFHKGKMVETGDDNKCISIMHAARLTASVV
jgi:hypothetical protein